MSPARRKKTPKRGTRRVATEPKAAREEPSEPRPRSKVDYSFDLSERICDRVANGEIITRLCREDGMPTYSQLSSWVRTKPDFAKRYKLAGEMQAQYWVSEAVEIADDALNDYTERVRRDGLTERVFDREHFERSRMRVDLRKWFAARRLRQEYGDRTDVGLSTPDGPMGVKVEERSSLIDAIVKLVHPKEDGKTKPSGKTEEARER